MTNIPHSHETGNAVDTLSFIESFQYFSNQIEQRKPSIELLFQSRYKEIQERIALTTDLKALSNLHATHEFYQALGELLDIYDQFFKYTTRSFSALDRGYWTMLIDGEKLQKDNELLRDTVSNLMKQREIVMSYAKKFKSQIRKAA